MRRKIEFRVRIGEQLKTGAVWVDDDATDEERQAAVDENVADIDSWEDEDVELEGWGETGTVMEEGWAAMPEKEAGW